MHTCFRKPRKKRTYGRTYMLHIRWPRSDRTTKGWGLCGNPALKSVTTSCYETQTHSASVLLPLPLLPVWIYQLPNNFVASRLRSVSSWVSTHSHVALSCFVSALGKQPAHLYPTISPHKSKCLYWSNVPVAPNTVPCLFQSQIFISSQCLTGPFPHSDTNVSPSSNHFNVCLQSTEKELDSSCQRLESVSMLVLFFVLVSGVLGLTCLVFPLQESEWIAASCFTRTPVTLFSLEMRQQSKALFLYTSYIFWWVQKKGEGDGDANMLGCGCWRRIKYTGKASSERLGCDERERSGSETREWATGTARWKMQKTAKWGPCKHTSRE